MAIFRGVAALLLLLMLISCSDDDPGSDPSEPTSPATASTTPSPTGPVEPEPPEADKPTKASAIAFVKYFWTIVDYAQATADTVTLKSLASRNCAFCRGGVKYLDELRTKGGVVKSKPYVVKVTRTQLGTVGNSDIAAVTFRLRFPKAVEFYGEGDPRNARIPGGRRTYQFTLEWAPSLMTWRVQMVVRA